MEKASLHALKHKKFSHVRRGISQKAQTNPQLELFFSYFNKFASRFSRFPYSENANFIDFLHIFCIKTKFYRSLWSFTV